MAITTRSSIRVKAELKEPPGLRRESGGCDLGRLVVRPEDARTGSADPSFEDSGNCIGFIAGPLDATAE
jgi:hypothetical protein